MQLSRRLLICERPDGKLRPVLDAQFSENTIQVFLDRAFGQVKFIRYLLVELRLTYKVYDLLFPKTQVLFSGPRS